jgi:hypothetical protein
MTQNIQTPQSGGWVIDKKVPLSTLFAVVAQTIVIAWGASKMDSRVQNLEEKITVASVQAKEISDLRVEVARLHVYMEGMGKKK